MDKPAIIQKLEKDFIAIIEADEKPDISADKVLKFITGAKNATALRNMIYGGEVPFAFGKNGGKHGRGHYYIPKLALYNWFNQRV